MLAIRLYVAALAAGLTCVFGFTRGIGTLEAIVVTCPILFMIFDVRVEQQELKQLQKRVAAILAEKH